MRVMIAAILMSLSAAAATQPTGSGVCEQLDEFDSLSTEEFESLETRLATQVAECYAFGPLDTRDVTKAMTILEVPAMAGNTDAMHLLASLQVFESDDPEKQRAGFLSLQAEAEAGSAYAAGKVGYAYALGRGVDRDEERALEQYFVAAKAGMTYWQYLLAHAYEQGYYDLQVNEEQARYWREFQPKVHIIDYECVIAGNYERGLFPPNAMLEERYRMACYDIDRPVQ